MGRIYGEQNDDSDKARRLRPCTWEFTKVYERAVRTGLVFFVTHMPF